MISNVSSWPCYKCLRCPEYQMASGEGKLVDDDKKLLEGKREAERLEKDFGFPFC